ncbi:MAG: tRNA(Ile)-lysidine synthetase [Chloroflexi bacterium]|nr:tRNA(Ile)-lysidine synthetase [Chloroflexota bacterium]
MKCRMCGEKAAINMRQHKLALCREHYLEWLPQQVQKAIEHYRMFERDERVLVAVSGGKDSLSLWDILWRLGYSTEGLYIGLGIQGEADYSLTSRDLSQKFADERALKLNVVDVRELYGATIPEAATISNRGHGKPCSVCGLVKRHVMNRVARDGGFGVLVTGHNLDDEAAVLMQNTLHWAGGYLVRQAPVLLSTHPGLARKAKPFCRIYERETAAYALLRGIEYIYDECPFAVGSTTLYNKDILNTMEGERPGTKLQFYLSFLQAKEQGLFAPQPPASELNTCLTCGQPTSAPGTCTFCRLWEKVRAASPAARSAAGSPM